MAVFSRRFFTVLRYVLVALGGAWFVSARSDPRENDFVAAEVPEEYAFLYHRDLESSHAELRARLPVERIELERTGCLGSCPVYRVSLSRTGQAVYEGEHHVDRSGRYVGEVYLWYFAQLAYALERIDFEDLDRSYRPSAWVSDRPTFIVTVAFTDGREVQVSDYGSQAPPEFWLLTKAIDAVAEDIEWSRPQRR